jgi:hypothetical protein
VILNEYIPIDESDVEYLKLGKTEENKCFESNINLINKAKKINQMKM